MHDVTSVNFVEASYRRDRRVLIIFIAAPALFACLLGWQWIVANTARQSADIATLQVAHEKVRADQEASRAKSESNEKTQQLRKARVNQSRYVASDALKLA